MNTPPVIQLSGVHVPTRRDPTQVSIPDVNWTVHENEFWVVGGPQGSGKSDLMFLLAGLTQPIEGSYKLFEQDMTRHSGDDFLPSRLKVGLVFDDARLFGHLTVAENVSLPARYHNDLYMDEAEAWTTALLRTTGVADFAHVTPSNIPRHWRRRAALARALAVRPKVLFLENPLRGLDPRQTAWWLEFVYQLWRGHDLMRGERMTLIVSTDEFRPWRLPRAHFATLDESTFSTHGQNAPEESVAWPEFKGDF
jgi:ABC-type transporter Mla maintaining outer membrane lipid asymmetry ATPase subunit MlaF